MITPAAGNDSSDGETGLARRLGFRFLFAFVVLYALPFPLGQLPWTEKVTELWSRVVDPFVVWVGANVLAIDRPIATAFNGSGDRTYDYVLLFAQLTLAAAAAAVWCIVDRRGRHDRVLREGLRLYIRVLVGYLMLSYGFAKIFPGQFSPPTPGQLAKTYGESSPMNLLWTFMGASTPYRMFAGFMEAIPGALLLFRRTAALGALLLLPVLANVVMLNLCYDVPVKIFSTQLLLLCLYLAAPTIARLLPALILSRPVAAPPVPPPPPRWFQVSRRARVLSRGLYVLVAGALAYQTIYPQWKATGQHEDVPPEARAIRNAFDVEEMTLDGLVLAPGSGDDRRWNRVSIRGQSIAIRLPGDRSELYRTSAEVKGPMTLELSRWEDPAQTRRALVDLRWDGDRLVLEGTFEGQKVRARLAKREPVSTLLMTRGFHWISEVPFNR